MHLYLEPIDVHTQQELPITVCWRGRLFDVERILETWSSRHAWWGREDIRTYYLMMTSRGVIEIYSGTDGWMLSRVWD
jgi:hypothetical protein